ncbi:hypothetical protein [Candidatus Uabimicrobium sp. HlEnr_7]|uniref:hypothetical protein n=1 Tax=Candidatus Uabimicrobium helgolandensis TaxID=3095367 RepID=UPI00355634A5
MLKNILLSLIIAFSFIAAENANIAQRANSLEFLGKWVVERSTEAVTQLKQDDKLLQYNGFTDFPAGSGHHVADSKTFARIIVSSECGYALPSGLDYATHSVAKVEAGDVLQKNSPEAHTMVVIDVQGEEVTVIHSGWGAHHCVSRNVFVKSFLQENNFKVFKPGIDPVANDIEPEVRQQAQARVLGSYRVVVTGQQDYFPISQGTIISHSGPGGKVIVNETRTVSNKVSASVGIKADIVTAGVGFDVTSTFSRSLSYWRDVAPGKYAYVDLVYKYTVKNFDIYYKPFLGSEKRVGSGKAYRWQAVQFNYRESNN